MGGGVGRDDIVGCSNTVEISPNQEAPTEREYVEELILEEWLPVLSCGRSIDGGHSVGQAVEEEVDEKDATMRISMSKGDVRDMRALTPEEDSHPPRLGSPMSPKSHALPRA
jgi:hypothetical protein